MKDYVVLNHYGINVIGGLLPMLRIQSFFSFFTILHNVSFIFIFLILTMNIYSKLVTMYATLFLYPAMNPYIFKLSFYLVNY